MHACEDFSWVPPQEHKPGNQEDTLKVTGTPDAAKAAGFSYDRYSKLGPSKWEDIDFKDSEYFEWIQDRRNDCDGKYQSPVDIDPNNSCPDDHKINFRRGKFNFDTMDFTILPHALRANLHQDPDGNVARANFSNLSDWVPAIYVEVKVCPCPRCISFLAFLLSLTFLS